MTRQAPFSTSRAPAASTEAVRKVMQGNQSADTKPELQLRRALHAHGLRYRKNAAPDERLRCRADVVFSRAQVCVFVDGCFWHGCPEHFDLPETNTVWWRKKIETNTSRDERQTHWLKEHGWTVLRYWEHEVMSPDLPVIVQEVAEHVGD